MILNLGTNGADVKRLQQALNLLVPRSDSALSGSQLPALVEDGIFGPKTQARVREFQGTARLKTDGIVGALTTKSLMAATLGSTFSLKRR